MTAPIEFERKFLVHTHRLEAILAQATRSIPIEQGYFMDGGGRCVRIRSTGSEYILTFKSATGEAGKAIEVEMPISTEHAKVLLDLSLKGVSKVRHIVEHAGFTWEVDVFGGHNEGLVLAEVELDSDAASAKLTQSLPDWVAQEVTGDAAYFNTALAIRPV